MNQYRNVILLALAQACFLATSMTMVTFAGLAGITSAPDPKFATLPVTLSIVSTALTTAPMSMIMQRTSRRFGFRMGASVGVLAALMMAYAVYSASFILLCVGALMVGPFQSSAQYYRFAAAESVPPALSPRAISFVLIGGLVASFFVPALWRIFGDLFADVDYMGAFIFAAIVVAFVTALSGIEVMHFSIALIALGLGWNFCFVGGTTLLTRVHTRVEKGSVQGLNEFLVFSTTGVASFAAGLILNLYGWQTVNQAAFVMLVIASAITLVWGLAGQIRKAAR